jgi:hypothetical protein
MPQLTRPAWPPTWPIGPLWSVSLGQLDPVQQDPRSYFISRNFRKCSNIAKIIEYSLIVRKIQMTYQNVQKINFCMFTSHSYMIEEIKMAALVNH